MSFDEKAQIVFVGVGGGALLGCAVAGLFGVQGNWQYMGSLVGGILGLINSIFLIKRGGSSIGRALEWHSRGNGFNSHPLHSETWGAAGVGNVGRWYIELDERCEDEVFELMIWRENDQIPWPHVKGHENMVKDIDDLIAALQQVKDDLVN